MARLIPDAAREGRSTRGPPLGEQPLLHATGPPKLADTEVQRWGVESSRTASYPPGYGQAFEVRKGQVLRIHAVEDGQVGDCCFFNANDYKEWFHVGQTWVLNVVRKTGNGQYYTYFYSKPPRENLMFTVLEDT